MVRVVGQNIIQKTDDIVIRMDYLQHPPVLHPEKDQLVLLPIDQNPEDLLALYFTVTF